MVTGTLMAQRDLDQSKIETCAKKNLGHRFHYMPRPWATGRGGRLGIPLLPDRVDVSIRFYPD
jgi:hypothetical protein